MTDLDRYLLTHHCPTSPYGPEPPEETTMTTCIHRPHVAYCVEPGCRCDHRHGLIVDDPAQWERPGYRVERGGLCPECQADYDEDPGAWEEFGDHPAGIARRAELERELEEERAALADAPPIDWTGIPF